MARIRINSVPDGEAPEWVRNEWVGLKLPIYEDFGLPTKGKAPEIISGRLRDIEGFSVPTDAAILVLQVKSPKAAEWWDLTFTDSKPPYLVFPVSCCEVLPSLSALERNLELNSVFGIAHKIGQADVVRVDKLLDRWVSLHGLTAKVFETKDIRLVEAFWGLVTTYEIELTSEEKKELWEQLLWHLEEDERIRSIFESSRQ